jgi:hypothetical protein
MNDNRTERRNESDDLHPDAPSGAGPDIAPIEEATPCP